MPGHPLRSAVARLLVGSLLLLGTAASASAQTGASAPAAPSSLRVLVDQIVALYPKLEGEVLEVQGKTVTLSLGRRDGLPAGVELSLFRQGRELRHPTTGEILGRAEEPVGRVLVQQVLEQYATATLVSGTDPRPGDRARISSGKIRLTVMPLIEGVKDALVEAAVQDLVDGLNRSGRFQVAMGDAVSVSLTEAGVKRPEMLEGKGLASVAERYKIDNLLVVFFKRVERKPYMDVRLFTFPGTNGVLTTAMFVPPSIKPPPKGQFSASDKQRDSQSAHPQRSLLARLLTGDLDSGAYSSGETSIPLKEVAKFPFVVTGFDLAVSPVDKIPRMVITDGLRIFLYRLVDGALQAEWTYKPDNVGRVFAVQLAQLTSDGAFQVVVNRWHQNPNIGLTSFILATNAGKPVPAVENIAMILLAVDAKGDGVKQTLWGESFSEKSFFNRGQADRYVLRDGKLVSEGPAAVPSTFRATGATFANIAGKDVRALAYVDEYHRMRITVGAEDMWRSSSPVGGGLPKLGVQTQIERGGRIDLFQPEVAPLAVDLDGDGIDEVVAAENDVPGRLAVIYRGPAGYRFQTVNSGFEGTITGLGSIPGDGSTPILVASVVRYYGVIGTAGETQIIMTTGE